MSKHRRTEVYTWNSSGDEDLADFTRRVVERRPDRVVRPGTRWQRFWRNPLTHLALAIYFTTLAFTQHGRWYLTALYLIVAVFSWVDFWNKADDRWGKP